MISNDSVSIGKTLEPLCISGDGVKVRLEAVTKPLTLKYESMYLILSGMFGEIGTPNIDLYWCLIDGNKEYLGSVSFFGCQPKSEVHQQGNRITIAIPNRLQLAMIRTLKNNQSLQLCLQVQQPTKHDYSASIELIALKVQPRLEDRGRERSH